MAKLKSICEFLDKYLETTSVEDACWNGLQFEGCKDVKKIIFSVDASSDCFNMASKQGAGLIIVHHGHFWKNLNPSYSGWAKQRLEILRNSDISLYASHLPLDRHTEVGNNVQILRILGAIVKEGFLSHSGTNIGWIGEITNGISIDRVESILTERLNAECKVLPFGNSLVHTIAVCSGGGGYKGFYEALEKSADLYITGDTAEIYFTAKDSGINVIFAGHHATETVGLKALSEVVERKFDVETLFLDLPTGL